MSPATATKGRPPHPGPQCPFCSNPAGDWLQSGVVTCPQCARTFEATVFQPPETRLHVVPVLATTGPAGANACANHPGNSAVTSCKRCGLFICALCDMNVGTGSYCPACFDRVRADEELDPAKMRVRDFAGLAKVMFAAGIFMWFASPVFATLSFYYARKGVKQREEMGERTWTLYVIMLLAALQIAGGVALIGVFVAMLAGVLK